MTLPRNPRSSVALAHEPLDADDPRTTFAQAVALGSAVVGRIGPHQLANRTPCPEFDVRDLLGHLVMVLRRVAAIGRGDDPFGPSVVEPVEGDRWQAAWLAAADDVEKAWADGGALRRIVRLPWSQDTGAVTLLAYLNEVTVHTWDLATATGQRPAWDPKVVSLALDGIRFLRPEGRAAVFEEVRATMPPGRADFADPFADAVPVHEDAPLIARLVAWNGRDPW